MDEVILSRIRKEAYEQGYQDGKVEGYNLAGKALLPRSINERVKKMNDDTISRQAAIDAILHNQEVYSNNFGDDPIDKYTIAIIENDAQTIVLLPSAERRGRWDGDSCSVRGFSWCDVTYDAPQMQMPYCPNCGASMDDVEETSNATQHTECVGNALDALDEVEE